MKNSLTIRVLPLSLAALVLAGCATNRPPRSGRGQPVPVDPYIQPAGPTSPMPPPFEDPTLKEEVIVAQPLPPVRPSVSPRVSPPKVQPKSGTPYTIKKGESLSAVAAKHRIGWKRLAEYNLIQNPNRVYAGQVILIPPGHAASAGGSSSRPVISRPAPPQVVVGDGTYVVQSGDSLSVIAQRYGTTVRNLKSANNLTSDRLLVGQILKLPQGSELTSPPSGGGSSTLSPQPTPVATRPIPPPPTPSPDADIVPPPPDGGDEGEGEDEGALNIIDKPYPIIVQEGDTLQSIAENYIVTEAKIRELNNLKEGEEVTPGQKLMMPATIY